MGGWVGRAPTWPETACCRAGVVSRWCRCAELLQRTPGWLLPEQSSSPSTSLLPLGHPPHPTHSAQVVDSDVEEQLQLLTTRHLASERPLSAQHPGGLLAPLPELLAVADEAWRHRAAHLRACLEEGGACDCCVAGVRVLCITPDCAHLLCVDCVSKDRTKCVHCSTPYVMQAGGGGNGGGGGSCGGS